jgi:uncharacterized membrane protein YjjP (DUF1212 family)
VSVSLGQSRLVGRGKDIPADFDDLVAKLRRYGRWMHHIGWTALAMGVLRLMAHYM